MDISRRRGPRLRPRHPRNCLVCLNLFFVPVGSTQFLCSRTCAHVWSRRHRVTRTCPACLLPFVTIPCDTKVCCSRSCARRLQSIYCTHPCPVCGVLTGTLSWHRRRGWGTYCSSTCQHAAQVVPRKTFVCGRPGCGRVKSVVPSRQDRYCSRLCYLMMRTGVRTGTVVQTGKMGA